MNEAWLKFIEMWESEVTVLLCLNQKIYCARKKKKRLQIENIRNDPSEIILICWFGAQETCIFIMNVENNGVAFFPRNHGTYSIFHAPVMNRKFKRTAFLK